MAVSYRESYGMFNCCGILYNHESPRRDESYVTRKISKGVAHIKAGLQQELRLGNLSSKRDWGFAKDYVEAMWLMLQQAQPDDYVIATGTAHSVQAFVERAFSCADLDWEKFVQFDSSYDRPIDVDDLIGDASKAEKALGWKPRTGFDETVQLMVEADMEAVVSNVTAHTSV
jgi:GDPmannose 4,6-dehydratase